MNIEEARKNLLDAHRYFESQSEGYKSWGGVKVLQIAQRVSATEFLLTDEKKPLEDITEEDIKIVSSSSSIFQQLFLFYYEVPYQIYYKNLKRLSRYLVHCS